MTTSSLLESISFFKPSPIKFPHLPSRNPNFIRFSPKFALNPSLTPKPKPNRNPLAEFKAAIAETLETLKKPAIAVVLLGFLLTSDPYPALAASGGRMGGRSFSSSSSSSSSRSYSYSAPSSGSSFSYSAPYYAPSPFGAGGGFYMGPAFGIGAGSGFFLLMMGFAAVILLSGFLSDRSDDGSVLTATQKTTVLKLQV